MIAFTIPGKPEPAGSKRGFYNKHTGRTQIVDASSKSRPWKAQVSDAAIAAMTDERVASRIPLLDGPLQLELVFYVIRPKGHFGKHGLRASAPAFPTVRPDVLKLARAVEDALSGIVYRDDAQIVTERLLKRYGEPTRCEVVVTQLPPEEVAA